MRFPILAFCLCFAVGCSSSINFTNTKDSAAYLTPTDEIVMINCFNHPESDGIILKKASEHEVYVMEVSDITKEKCNELGYKKISFASYKQDKSAYPRFGYVRKRLNGTYQKTHVYILDLHLSDGEKKEIAFESGKSVEYPDILGHLTPPAKKGDLHKAFTEIF